MSSQGRHRVLGFIIGVSLAIGTGFALAGAWLILPFAGLEMLGLLAAFRWIGRHAGDFERIVVDGDRVRLEVVDTGRSCSVEFNRLWAQVRVAEDGRWLVLRSHGREVEFGRHLTADQRLTVAKELGRELCRGR